MIDAALAEVRSAFPGVQERLAELVAIPGISAAAFPAAEVRRSAAAVAEALVDHRFDDVRLLETGGHPAVYAARMMAPDAPVLLIYGHHDVQPPGRSECWISPPFHAEVRNGRMYGRGTADDKGGFLAYVAAVDACAAAASLPCSVKLIIEGAEEIGSPGLSALLQAHRDLFACDFIVLCDTPNFANGVPALTYRLRGNCIVDVEVRCLERPLHSGQGGGLAPDATMILCRLLARLYGDDGTLAVPGLEERVSVDASQLDAMRALPFDASTVSRNFGFAAGVRFPAEETASWERVWARPSLTITALESVPVAHAANQIADRARARLSLRTVRDLDTLEGGRLLARALQSNVPFGAKVTVDVAGGPSWWETDPQHPVFTVARRALSRAYGREAVMIGSGGSIGFVRPFAEIAGNSPPLLTGVQDPSSNAHAENESLDLDDWQKAMDGAIHLIHDLAEYHHDGNSRTR